MPADLIVQRPEGLYCEAGDFYIDPWRPVDRAVITHAHADHARSGHAHYLAHDDAVGVLRARLGSIDVQGMPYGQTLRLGEATVSLHPAGHVLGSSQVRVQAHGQVWVVSGDYFVSGARDSNTTCAPFEPVRCDCFVTESTFGLPIFRWQPQHETMAAINAWWSEHARDGRNCLLLGYSFGKAQRLLAGVDANIGAIWVHPAVERVNEAYRAAGVALAPCQVLDADTPNDAVRASLVIAPPGVHGSAWTRRLGADHVDAFASGWMRLRGARRRQGVDRGFVLSDHADWPGLVSAIEATGASRVIVTHGYEDVLVRWLTQRGLQASSLATEYSGDTGDALDAHRKVDATSTES